MRSSFVNPLASRRFSRQGSLRASNLREIADGAPIGIAACDARGRIVYANPQLGVLLGCDARGLVGRPLAELVDVTPGKRHELTYRRPDGSHVWALVDVASAENGRVASFQDISERKREEAAAARTRDALRLQVAELSRSNSELFDFADAVSHDLADPLETISLYAQALESRYIDTLDTGAQRLIGSMIAGVEQLQDRVHELLAYSRAGYAADPVPVACAGLVEDVIVSLESALAERSAEIAVHPLPTVWGMPEQLARLFQNLIANALRHGVSERPLFVEVGAEVMPGGTQFFVRDNGPGVAPEDAQRIFEAHQRGAAGDRRGSGIGLALCRRIVEAHDGRIWVEPSDGRSGATFVFVLPGARPFEGESAPRSVQTTEQPLV